MLMANQLKQIAKDYNVFIFSATQVNAQGMQQDSLDFKDFSSVRGSKAIVDKADLAFILTKITPNMWESIIGDFRKYSREGYIKPELLEEDEYRPTHILDVYKNRRGRLKDVRIWTHLDLGTGYRRDCFITTTGNYPIEIPDDTLFTTHVKMLGDWREMMKEGTF